MLEVSEVGSMLAALQAIGFSPSLPEPFYHSDRLDRNCCHVHAGRPALGSFVDVTVIDPSADRAAEATAQAFAELGRLAQLYDRHHGDTAISDLNARGRLKRAPHELVSLLVESRRLAALSGGAFDVTVAPLVDLFRNARDTDGRLPAEQDVESARALVGGDVLVISSGNLALTRGGAAITLDGIAKGSIVDGMAAVLERHGLHRWLINAGGDLRSSGTNERDEPWTVAVRDPSGPWSLPRPIHLTDGAVATSGCHALAVETGPVLHEIVDGAHGLASSSCATVTVVAPTAAEADALATAAFVLGPARGTYLIEQLRRACLMVLPDGSVHRSSTWKERTT